MDTEGPSPDEADQENSRPTPRRKKSSILGHPLGGDGVGCRTGPPRTCDRVLPGGRGRDMKNRRTAASRSPDPSQEPARNPSLGGEIRGKIGRQLRDMYDDVVAQGVPDRFVELLNRLEKPNEK